jgi:hypothetical protein
MADKIIEETKTFLKFVEETYWADAMTSKVARMLREKL